MTVKVVYILNGETEWKQVFHKIYINLIIYISKERLTINKAPSFEKE